MGMINIIYGYTKQYLLLSNNYGYAINNERCITYSLLCYIETSKIMNHNQQTRSPASLHLLLIKNEIISMIDGSVSIMKVM